MTRDWPDTATDAALASPTAFNPRLTVAGSGLAALLTALAACLGLRLLLAGSDPGSISLSVFAVATGLLLGVAGCLHWAVRPLPVWLQLDPASRWSVAIRAAPAVALLVNLAALTHLGRPWALAVAWLAGAAAIALLWRRWPPNGTRTAPADEVTEVADDEAPQAEDQSPTDGDSQRIVRRIDQGQELLRLWQRIEIPAWERQATVHWPFWPALGRVPDVSAEALAESPAAVVVEQCERYGCRIRINLEEADERPQHVELEAVAICPADD